jgi:riboflavin biosynthesis pyrimidine reductase
VILATYGYAQEANATDAESLADSYGAWTGIRSNHVLSSTGSFAGSDGSSRSISTKEDRELLLALRARADLIVVDAATARLEQYRAPKSKTALAIFSLSGDFSGIPAVASSETPIYLFTGNSSPLLPENNYADVVPISPEPFESFLEWANSLSFYSILLEAGPTLTTKAIKANVVRQSAITRTGPSANSDPMQLANPFDSNAQLVSFAQADGASFSLWNH